MNEKVRWQVAHCEKNRINLDSSSQSVDSLDDEYVEVYYNKDAKNWNQRPR